MNLIEKRKQIGAELALVMRQIKKNRAMSTVQLIDATGITPKCMRGRLTEAQKRGLLTFVQVQGASLWCEPKTRDEILCEHQPCSVKRGAYVNSATSAERLNRVLALLTACPAGVKPNAICIETGIGKTSTKKYLHELRERGLVENYPPTGGVYSVWFLAIHRAMAIDVYEGARNTINDARRKRKNGQRWALPADDEEVTSSDFFERRIIPAHLAPPMVIRGPVSVFQLGAACT